MNKAGHRRVRIDQTVQESSPWCEIAMQNETWEGVAFVLLRR